MPAVHFHVRWPDGGVDTCYSPSTIVKTYFRLGHPYTMGEFLEVCSRALHAASDRVRERYGGAGCSRAMAQLAAIQATAARQPLDGTTVRIEGFSA